MKKSVLSSSILALVAAGCAVGADNTVIDADDTASSELVSTAQPYACSASQLDLQALSNASGQFALKGKLGTEVQAAGQFMDGSNMLGAPVADRAAWKNAQAADSTSCDANAPKYRGYLEAALGEQADPGESVKEGADAFMSMYPPNAGAAIGSLKEEYEKLGLPIKDSYFGPVTKDFRGFSVERARWLRSQYVRNYTNPVHDVLNSYQEPAEMQDLRQQAGRLYCAFREAQSQKPATHAMGRMPAFSANILGKKIDFLVVKPTVALGSPEKHMGTTGDGAEAVTIPMVFGNQVTPVDAFGLPALKEVRAPFVMVAGDSEVSRKAMSDTLLLKNTGFGGLTTVLRVSGYRKEYQTIAHSDAMLASGQTASVTTGMTLMKIGMLDVDASFKVSMSSGLVEAFNDRVLMGYSATFPQSFRVGERLPYEREYHDGAWQKYRTPEGVVGFKVYPDTANWRYTLPGTELGPLYTRALQDDDHHLSVKSQAHLEMGLAASFGFKFGRISMDLSAGGTISGTVTQHHDVRDALWADVDTSSLYRATASNGVTVRPRTSATADVHPLSVTMNFKLDIPLHDIEWSQSLLNMKPINLASYDSDVDKTSDGKPAWSERARLRVGVGSEKGKPMKQPAASIHYPGADDASQNIFPSMPYSVDQCLSEPEPELPVPAPCAPPPVNTEVPSTNLCAYVVVSGDSTPPQNVCANISSNAGGLVPSSGLTACSTALLTYLCGGTHLEQSHGPVSTAVARITDEAAVAHILTDLESCAVGAVDAGYSDTDISNWFTRFVQWGPCDGQARLLSSDEIMSAAGDPTKTPSVTENYECKQ